MSQYLQYAGSILGSTSLAVGRVHVGASLDGRTIIDAFLPFQAANSVVYERGAEPRIYTVTIRRFFATEGAALAFLLTHPDTLPRQGDLTIVDDVAAVAITMADAVAAVRMVEHVGTMVLAQYTFTGAKFESDDVPEAPTDTDTVKAQVVDLDADDVAKAVVFASPFASPPRFVRGEISVPDGGVAFHAVPRESTRLAAGVTFDFTAAVPASGYKLLVFAVL